METKYNYKGGKKTIILIVLSIRLNEINALEN